MKSSYNKTINNPSARNRFAGPIVAACLFSLASSSVAAQVVNEVITDYNGYWKSGTTAQNTIKPDNNHNLLAFSYNGTTYSTGVNDALLTTKGQTFVAADFRALPMQNLTAAPNSETKIGIGAMVEGLHSNSGVGPSRSLAQYLNDGVNGLNIGTAVANLPAGSMFLSVGTILTANIGDNVPDMLITQVADPSGQYDRYEFTDINGVRVGNSVDIVLNNIPPVGKWTVNFFEATGSTILTPGLSNTPRDLRLWAADFSAFGINVSNVATVAYFRIILKGTSDIAFVAYNTKTITLNSTMSLTDPSARLSRNTTGSVVARTMNIFPNPATNSFTFSHDVARNNENMMIYNMQGVLMLKNQVARGSSKTVINISSLKSGSYQVVYTDGIEKNSSLLVVR
ncbi:MAG TPA: T9SS type A sorting domain-containing protein [Flavitalea sp.]|nr:T9SS type A sorting domain-containing protein [Flavitalea sp.]